MKFWKWIGYLFLLILLGIAGYTVYFFYFYNDIPRTKPNVNERPLGEFTLKKEIFSNDWGDEMEIEQGTIVVPENRNHAQSNRIALSFIRIPSRNSNPIAPIFFLAGGPGTPGSSVFRRSYFYVFKRLSEYADVILIDQRGTGNSIPNLRCRNSMEMPIEDSNDWEQDILADITAKCKECAMEFLDMNIDLKGYNSKQSAHDIDEVRKALKLDTINLFGYSYGTTLAQHYVAMYPQHTERLICAGPTAPDLALKLPQHVEEQYVIMDSLLALDPRLKKYIPEFTGLMQSQHDRLKTEPLQMKLPLMDAVGDDDGSFFISLFKVISWFKPYWKLTLSDTHLKVMMAQNLGRSSWTAIAPRYYYQLSQGEHNRLGNYLRNFRRQPMPNALFFTVAASTRFPQNRWEEASTSREDQLLSHFDISFGRHPRVLESFGIEPIPELNNPVFSNHDLLLIGGTLDGRTPLSNLDTVYDRFENGQKIIVHHASHDDLVDDQVLDLIVRFVQGDSIGTIELYRDFTFMPPVSYRYNIADTLEAVRLQEGIDEALNIYDEIRKAYLDQEDYIYNLEENSLNSYGYALLQDRYYDAAIAVFSHNLKLFPDSYNVYNSLAEAQIAKGDFKSALDNLEKAISINYLDGYSHGLLRRYANQN